jgi:hypothetical protein
MGTTSPTDAITCPHGLLAPEQLSKQVGCGGGRPPGWQHRVLALALAVKFLGSGLFSGSLLGSCMGPWIFWGQVAVPPAAGVAEVGQQ